MKKHKKQTYDYIMSRDRAMLSIDAATCGAIMAIQDGITDYSPVEMDIRALIVCEELKLKTKARHISNDFYTFCDTFKHNFIINYNKKQEMFKSDESSYVSHLQDINKRGGYGAAFEQMRQEIADTLEERIVG
jgi:hypothetical protein